MNIVFMGSPDFAIPSLEKLYHSNHTITAVVTNVDKRRGRGGGKSPTPIKEKALEYGLPLLEVEDLKSVEFKQRLSTLHADLFVVVAFRVLPKYILEIPRIGSINLHASLLPKYRGAAPIHWAVMRGEDKTGCTIFFLDEKVDTGKIILQRETKIGSDENTGEVYNRLMHIGSEALLEAVNLIGEGNVDTKPQNDTLATPAPKLFKEHCHIDFNQPAEIIHNKIRGLSPFPTAFTLLNGDKINVYKAKIRTNVFTNVGKILIKDEKLLVGCKGGAIELLEIQPPGKKRMQVSDFLKGNSVEGCFE
jgi:methionyl-tRNA formyltransferase